MDPIEMPGLKDNIRDAGVESKIINGIKNL